MPIPDATAPLARLAEVARHPRGYIERWRSAHPGQPVVGVLPMNFPREIAHAAGTLPVVVQDDQQPVTEGRSLLAEFYCGYTRNLADQAATGRLDCYDALFLADHCIQLIGAADVVRAVLPETPVFFGMLISSMSDTWAPGKIAEMMGEFRDEFASFTGHPVTEEALASSIRAHNQDRQLIRRLFDERSSGSAAFTPRQLQDIVAASMIMDPAEHHALLAEAAAAAREAPRDDRVRIHLSAHLCHAPKRELLDLIEDSGAIVVDDDLFHGRRYVSTDVDEAGDPIDAIARWYARRNVNIPCPTRVQQDADWDAYLVAAVRASGAEAVIHLLPKFCEPQEPQLIDTADPILGMAQHYLLCPTNHGTKTLDYLTLRDCREYDVDGIVFHSTRTCRAFTGPQRLLAKSAQDKLGIPSIFFEGDVADASFYKEEILEGRLAAMLEAIDVRRARALAAVS